MNTYGGKSSLVHRWGDCFLDGPGEVDDELNEKYVSFFKPAMHFAPKEMEFLSA